MATKMDGRDRDQFIRDLKMAGSDKTDGFFMCVFASRDQGLFDAMMESNVRASHDALKSAVTSYIVPVDWFRRMLPADDQYSLRELFSHIALTMMNPDAKDLAKTFETYLRAILERGMNPNQPLFANARDSMLHTFVNNRPEEDSYEKEATECVIRLLLEFGADINILEAGRYGKTVL